MELQFNLGKIFGPSAEELCPTKLTFPSLPSLSPSFFLPSFLPSFLFLPFLFIFSPHLAVLMDYSQISAQRTAPGSNRGSCDVDLLHAKHPLKPIRLPVCPSPPIELSWYIVSL